MTETHDEYRVRMLRKCRQFSFFGIQPIWRPGEGDVEGFCHDEVVRQFHDTRIQEDGGKRVEGMINAWRYAEAQAIHTPTIEDVQALGEHVEPDYNRRGEWRHENVYIGDRMGVYPPFLIQVMEKLIERAPHVEPGTSRASLPNELQIEAVASDGQFDELVHTVDDWYLAYEWVHPFRDGNGRTGKILHNWLGGTLDEPVLVQDYFGGGNP